jgi:protein TonB
MTTAPRMYAATWEELNPARILAISTTLAVHIVAFGFLMVPLSLPERIAVDRDVIELTIVEPEKPEPVPLPILPTLPVEPARISSAVPVDVPAQIIETSETNAEQAVPMDSPVSDTSAYDNEPVGDVSGGEVDASTRAQYPIDYPAAAIRAGISGTVIVLATYNADGAVTATKIHQSSRNGNLDRAALAGVKKWKINPRQIDGQPQGGQAFVEVQFNL